MSEINNPIINRQKGASWFSKISKSNITIIGAGGIGSWITLFASRCNFNKITVFDADTVEHHNIGGQLYGIENIGDSKVYCLNNLCNLYSNKYINTFKEWFESKKYVFKFTDYQKYIILAVDNMKTRKDVMDSMLVYYKKRIDSDIDDIAFPPIVTIDIRLTAEMYQIIPVYNLESCEKWHAEYYFEDSEVEPLPCTFSQTSHLAAMVGGHTISIITNAIDMGVYPEYVEFSTNFIQQETKWAT